MITVIIPTYNEESALEGLLRQLGPQLHDGEIIVADGSSSDATCEVAQPYARIVVSEARRGRQLNCAAAVAQGDILCFLHADVRVPACGLAAVVAALQDPSVIGGTFSLSFGGTGRAARLLTRLVRFLRSMGVVFGDQGIFVRRSVFHRLGGFRDWPLLEDFEFYRRMVRAGITICLPEQLEVSSRRWERGSDGRSHLGRTVTSWLFILTFYLLGVSPDRLARWYPPVRGPKGAIPPPFRATQGRLN